MAPGGRGHGPITTTLLGNPFRSKSDLASPLTVAPPRPPRRAAGGAGGLVARAVVVLVVVLVEVVGW